MQLTVALVRQPVEQEVYIKVPSDCKSVFLATVRSHISWRRSRDRV